MSRREQQNESVRGLYVEVRNNDVGRAMRKLKKMLNNEGVMKEVREREFFEKPSLKRKKAKAAARKRWLKQQEKNQDR